MAASLYRNPVHRDSNTMNNNSSLLASALSERKCAEFEEDFVEDAAEDVVRYNKRSIIIRVM